MKIKEFFKNNKVAITIIVLIIIIMAVLLIGKEYWGWFAPSQPAPSDSGNQPSGTRMATNLKLSSIPSNRLAELSSVEKNVISSLFAYTNKNGASQSAVNRANALLQKAGSKSYFTINSPNLKPKCEGGCSCWSLNLVVFTYCHCSKCEQ